MAICDNIYNSSLLVIYSGQTPDYQTGPKIYCNDPKFFGRTCLVQSQIRLLLKEKCDEGIHCLLFHLHLLDITSW